MSTFPSIFNDVIGPVMRGPSSSHCAASLRIARLCRDLMDENIQDIFIEFDPNGSLATTHKSQGSDMGLFGGFLGWEAYDERLPESEKYLEAAGIKVSINICDINADHPNTYKITLSNAREIRRLTAISTGGGMIEVINIDGVGVSMAGDYFETLIYCTKPDQVIPYLQASIPLRRDPIPAWRGIQFHSNQSPKFPGHHHLPGINEYGRRGFYQIPQTRIARNGAPKPASALHHLRGDAGVQRRQKQVTLGIGRRL